MRTPLILMTVAATLAGVVYWIEFNRSTVSQNHLTPSSPINGMSPTRLFEFQECEIQGLSIKTAATIVVLEKEKTWIVRSPAPTAPASEAVVAFLTNLLTSPRHQAIQVPAARRSEFGLDQPLATIEITTVKQQRHRLILGRLNFDRTGLYALVDPSPDPEAELSIVVVPTSFESAVIRDGVEWRIR